MKSQLKSDIIVDIFGQNTIYVNFLPDVHNVIQLYRWAIWLNSWSLVNIEIRSRNRSIVMVVDHLKDFTHMHIE